MCQTVDILLKEIVLYIKFSLIKEACPDYEERREHGEGL